MWASRFDRDPAALRLKNYGYESKRLNTRCSYQPLGQHVGIRPGYDSGLLVAVRSADSASRPHQQSLYGRKSECAISRRWRWTCGWERSQGFANNVWKGLDKNAASLSFSRAVTALEPS